MSDFPNLLPLTFSAHSAIIKWIYSFYKLFFPCIERINDAAEETAAKTAAEATARLHVLLSNVLQNSMSTDDPDSSIRACSDTKPCVLTEDMVQFRKKIIDTFFAQLPRIQHTLQTDLQAAYDGDPAARSKKEIILAYPGFFATLVYRLAHTLHDLQVPLLPRMMTECAHSLTGIDIHPGAQIGSFFFMDHGTGIVIGETTIIGAHVKLYQGVTLGARSTRAGQALSGVKRHPTLEDHVTVYANATILGGDTIIGAGSVIGGNVFLTHSVPKNSRIASEERNHYV